VNRSEARERALSLLYEAEQRAIDPDTESEHARVRAIVDGVWSRLHEIDAAITSVATDWRVDRMPAVDRNLIRIGYWELTGTDLPVGVVISEAVRLAKEYSTERSGSFVNGILAKLAESKASPHTGRPV
jgi:N utilization substance protein B